MRTTHLHLSDSISRSEEMGFRAPGEGFENFSCGEDDVARSGIETVGEIAGLGADS